MRFEIKIEYLSDVLTFSNIRKVSDSILTKLPPTLAAENKVSLPNKPLYLRDQAQSLLMPSSKPQFLASMWNYLNQLIKSFLRKPGSPHPLITTEPPSHCLCLSTVPKFSPVWPCTMCGVLLPTWQKVCQVFLSLCDYELWFISSVQWQAIFVQAFHIT